MNECLTGERMVDGMSTQLRLSFSVLKLPPSCPSVFSLKLTCHEIFLEVSFMFQIKSQGGLCCTCYSPHLCDKGFPRLKE
jgi:hypothetical protein